jgi:predicted dithiol-disulfide oxidoreductase (DUF899 family)
VHEIERDLMAIKDHKIVSHDDWVAARTALLAKEKELTRLRDDLSRQRRELPWESVDKPYRFDTPGGTETLAQLFDHRSQLVIYHFMFGPDADAGCKHCSFWADNFNGIDVHLAHRDVAFVAVSRAPLAKIEAFKKRMDWSFKWVSSGETDFNYDYQASFRAEDIASGSVYFNYVKAPMPIPDREGISVFYKDDAGAVFHTYSTHARGIDMVNGAYHFLDLVPKGRDEHALESNQAWVRYHDKYED